MYLSKAFFKTEEFRSIPDPKQGEQLFLDFMRHGITHAFDNITDRPIVVDKCRSWIGSANLLFQTFPEAKLLVPVRDIRGVLSSMEKKYQQHPGFQMEGSQQDTARIQTIEGRCQFWLDTAPVGLAVQRLHELAKNHKDKVHFVHAEDLTSNPQETMNRVWEYLGIDPIIHNIENVEQYTQEHELGWPFGDHEIKPQVKPLKPDWHQTLGRQLSEALNQKFQWINAL
jgi:sulfotransferase